MCLDREKTDRPSNFEMANKLRQEANRLEQSDFSGKADGVMVGRVFTRAEILQKLFTYHPPNLETIPKYKAINQAAKNFAEIVLEVCPDGPTARAAVDLIIDAKMKANAAIALNGCSL